MKNIENLINQNSIYYKDLEYYFIMMKNATINLDENPDISIESCKSLIEGICKYILSALDTSYDDKVISKKKFRAIANLSLSKLAEYNAKIDDRAFISQALKFIDTLSETRNARGDTAHGKVSPKPESSSSELAMLIFDMTKAILDYILKIFFDVLRDIHEGEIQYTDEENESFNQYLDDLHELDGKLLYSKALFEQDYISYCDQLESFLANKEE